MAGEFCRKEWRGERCHLAADHVGPCQFNGAAGYVVDLEKEDRRRESLAQPDKTPVTNWAPVRPMNCEHQWLPLHVYAEDGRSEAGAWCPTCDAVKRAPSRRIGT
jgi:hypothetical protein